MTTTPTPNQLTQTYLNLIQTPTPPHLGPQPRPHTKTPNQLIQQTHQFAQTHHIPTPTQTLLQTAALIWHDHLQQAHKTAQTIHTPEGSYLHAIIHRREPDPTNAKHWYNKTTNHPTHTQLTQHIQQLKTQHPNQQNLLQKLTQPHNQWNPHTYTDTCHQTIPQNPNNPQYTLLQHIQQLEHQTLLNHILTQTQTQT